ncbi:hypothetical protein YC2023_011274 [Brassica napus]
MIFHKIFLKYGKNLPQMYKYDSRDPLRYRNSELLSYLFTPLLRPHDRSLPILLFTSLQLRRLWPSHSNHQSLSSTTTKVVMGMTMSMSIRIM